MHTHAYKCIHGHVLTCSHACTPKNPAHLIVLQSDTSSDDEHPSAPPDPFYDENLDDEDEQWMSQQRQGRISDAILSCPACFTTLCIDCQQHDRYPNQYRAMFVQNCKVILQAPLASCESVLVKDCGASTVAFPLGHINCGTNCLTS